MAAPIVVRNLTTPALISFLGYFFLFAYFAGNTFQTANKNGYVPLGMLSLEKQDDAYICNGLWTYTEGRPAYGGQLFSHLVEIALLQYPGWRVLSATCTFNAGGDVTKAISYTVETETQGSRFRHLQITGKQHRPTTAQPASNPLTAGATSAGEAKVVISGWVELVNDINDSFKPIVDLAGATDALRDYFPGLDGCSDAEKAKKMPDLDAYLAQTFEDNREVQKQLYSRHPYVNFTLMAHPDTQRACRRRCLLVSPGSQLIVELADSIGVKLDEPAGPQKSLAERGLTALLLSFFSDECLLETALLPVKQGLASSSVNILSVNHRISFLDLSNFDIHAPFFYVIDVKEVSDNLAYCTGEIIQEGRLYADISQRGVLRSKNKTRPG